MRTTSTEQRRPTPAQAWAWEEGRGRGRPLDTVALAPRLTAGPRCQVAVSRDEQEAERKALRAARPEYAALHAHLLQDVLARRDTTSQAFCRRVQRGEQAGFARCKGRDRSHRCPGTD